LGDRMVSSHFPFPLSAIYRRPGGHLSGAGNDLVARVFFQLLMGKRPVRYDQMRVLPAETPAGVPAAALDSDGGVDLWFGSERAARLLSLGGPEDTPMR